MFDYFMPKNQARNSMHSSHNPYASFMSNVGQSLALQINKLLQPLSIKDMEETMKKCQVFFKTIEAWKGLQQHYIAKLKDIQSTFREKSFCTDQNKDKSNQQKNTLPPRPSSAEIIDNELVNLFETLITNHKAMFDKIIYDISYVNLETFQNLSKEIKDILSEEKSYVKQLNSVRDQLEKVLSKKLKLKRQKDQELMLKIFMQDGTQEFMMDQKMKKHHKYNEIRKELEQYELKVQFLLKKVSESVDEYQRSSQNLKTNHLEYYQKIDRLTECKYETVMKMQLHLLTYYRNLVDGISNMSQEIQIFLDEGPDSSPQNSPKKKEQKNKVIYEEIQRKNKQNKMTIQENRRNEFQILQKLQQKNIGYVEYSLKIIDQKEFDDLLVYSRDKDVKGKIKKMIDSNEVNPEDTDQTCRQIQIIKKFIKSNGEQSELLQVFRNMVTKNSKLRMNFIFLLQFFRINGKFQLTIEQFKPIYKLINIFMEACHQNRDCFVLKQLMILLTTYFVTLEQPIQEKKETESQMQTDNSPFEDKSLSPELPIQLGELEKKKKKTSSSSSSISTKQKIYILQFFKDHQLWHDLEFWESLLIECIYAQKRNTIKNLVRGTQSTMKNQMLQAQKTAILNQILYVVRNMIIFDFTQKDVKSFGLRFSKLLKLDDRNIKDINKTVQEAAKQQIETKQNESIEKYLEKLQN